MDEDELSLALETYKKQLEQVSVALETCGSDQAGDLRTLKENLQELVSLTEGSLLSLKKSKLFSLLESSTNGQTENGSGVSTHNSNVTNSHPQQASCGGQSSNKMTLMSDAKSCHASVTPMVDTMDQEMLAFQAAIAEETLDKLEDDTSLSNHIEPSDSHNHGNYTNNERKSSNHSNLKHCQAHRETDSAPNICDQDSPGNSQHDVTSDSEISPGSPPLSDVIGTRCKVPRRHQCGTLRYHNALVIDMEPGEALDDKKVRVMFCTPTERSMLPCPYYLDGRCRFTEQSCRYSHGFLVDSDLLQDYEEPDYSQLVLYGECLAKDPDGIWQRAKILEMSEDSQTYQVMFEGDDKTVSLDVTEILPTEDHNDSPTSEADDGLDSSGEDSDSDAESFPVMLWEPGTGPLGGWEAHTKGIGSKLMGRMGYVIGQGLGKEGVGRVEPVPIELLPSGKSLDKIMELKEAAKDKGLFDVMKKQKKGKKRKQKNPTGGHGHTEGSKSVFDFINKKLGSKTGSDLHKSSKNRHGSVAGSQHISEKDLKSKTDRQINQQIFQTHEEIRATEKQMEHLRSSLARNEGKDNIVASQIRQKLSSLESYVEKLRHSENAFKDQKQTRTDRKKLTIF